MHLDESSPIFIAYDLEVETGIGPDHSNCRIGSCSFWYSKIPPYVFSMELWNCIWLDMFTSSHQQRVHSFLILQLEHEPFFLEKELEHELAAVFPSQAP
jgi:hypothetical protein